MGLSKNAIILAAEQNVSRGTELDTIAGIRLDAILDKLYENYNFEFLTQTPAAVTFTAGSPTWTIPTDYLKFLNMMLVRSDLNASNPYNKPLEKYDFVDYQRLPNPLQTGEPQFISILRTFTDENSPAMTGYVWPVPNITYTGRITYYRKPTYSISGTAEPTFPGTAILIDLLTNELLGMGYGKGEVPRQYDPALMEKVLRQMRLNAVDNGIAPLVARKDPRVFRPVSYSRTSGTHNWSRD